MIGMSKNNDNIEGIEDHFWVAMRPGARLDG